MEHSRAYFSDRFGIEATGFTVLVGADYEAMSPVFRDVTGKDLSWAYGSHLKRTHAWVGSSASGGAVVGLMYGHLSDRSLSILKHAIVHEYFHVLQGQLGSGFAQLQNGEIAWGFPRDRGPTWLVEGLASYADYAYTPSRPGRRQFLDDRYRPYLDLAWQRAIESDALDNLAMELARIEDRFAFRACSGQWHSYALSFIASTFLVEEQSESEDSYVNYWRLLGERATWQQAFEEALSEKVPFVSHIVAKGLADPTKIAHVAADEFGAVLMDISSMELERDVHPISRRKVNPKTSRLTDLQAGKSVVHGGLGSNKSASLGRD